MVIVGGSVVIYQALGVDNSEGGREKGGKRDGDEGERGRERVREKEREEREVLCVFYPLS